MQKFEKFYFNSFEFDKKTLLAKFFYRFDDKENFTEEIDFSSDFLHIRDDFQQEIFDNFLFSLSIALGISYYKLYPTRELVVKSGFLTEEDKQFWHKFYLNGLGEFLYKNKINPNGLFNFVNESDKKYEKIEFKTSDKIFLPIGGGKDSIVSAELLKRNSYTYTPFVFGKIDTIKLNCLKVTSQEAFLVKRKLDENIFRLNELGYYNGHVPITGIISFVLLCSAYLCDYRYLILSNEKSANIGNVKMGKCGNYESISLTTNSVIPVKTGIYSKENLLENTKDSKNFKSKFSHCHSELVSESGKCKNPFIDSLSSKEGQNKFLEVNHQYSKSLEFEQDLDTFIKRNLSNEIKYFSLLRGMYEIKIAEIFSKIGKDYFGVFSSCNKNFKINKDHVLPTKYWCNSCPKCAFVYAVLRPYLTDIETMQIFGKELYENKDLENLFKELLGVKGIKPFECVGEEDEVVYAMNEALAKFKKEKKDIPYILEIFEKEVKKNYDEVFFLNLKNKLFTVYNQETLIPEEIKTKILIG
ncbi:MAG: hypothetical protein PHN31_01075 [Candidatus Gracilibacteria bacterium]|nr:hypothetical protein [Candidatus Gracilibacteria bacterium]